MPVGTPQLNPPAALILSRVGPAEAGRGAAAAAASPNRKSAAATRAVIAMNRPLFRLCRYRGAPAARLRRTLAHSPRDQQRDGLSKNGAGSSTLYAPLHV